MSEHQKVRKALLLIVVAPVLLVGLALLVLFMPFYLAYGACLRLVVQLLWVVRGKRILVIYSRSPVWQTYVEDAWLPQLREQSVILNWSDRALWWRSQPLAACVFRHWAPRHGFNPMVILFGPLFRTQRISFYDAFRDWKHGNETGLRAAERRLFAFAGTQRRPGA